MPGKCKIYHTPPCSPFLRALGGVCIFSQRAPANTAHIIQPVSFDACYLAIILTHSLSLAAFPHFQSAVSLWNLNFSFWLPARSLARFGFNKQRTETQLPFFASFFIKSAQSSEKEIRLAIMRIGWIASKADLRFWICRECFGVIDRKCRWSWMEALGESWNSDWCALRIFILWHLSYTSFILNSK